MRIPTLAVALIVGTACLVLNPHTPRTPTKAELFGIALEACAEAAGKPDKCALFGKIKFVEHFPDVKVKVVQHFPDIKVKVVEHFPDGPGKWQMVEHFPDFKVQIVEHFPDYKIKYVEHFPGCD